MRGSPEKAPFCNNPKCFLHEYRVPENWTSMEVVMNQANVDTRRFQRHLFRASREKTIYLCDQCAHAIEISDRARSGEL